MQLLAHDPQISFSFHQACMWSLRPVSLPRSQVSVLLVSSTGFNGVETPRLTHDSCQNCRPAPCFFIAPIWPHHSIPYLGLRVKGMNCCPTHTFCNALTAHPE